VVSCHSVTGPDYLTPLSLVFKNISSRMCIGMKVIRLQLDAREEDWVWQYKATVICVYTTGNLPFRFSPVITKSSVLCDVVTVHNPLTWSLSSSCGRQSVDQFVLVSGLPLGPMTRFYLSLLYSLTAVEVAKFSFAVRFSVDSCGFVVL
jgi:hypothetical protein